ncbi:type II inositol 1,4,5-trisphosphate 5-phosphatase isoform X2 [Myxocyprinus asiaticus]|uniref:type II inositol 1,4,5-trisphosphate 5-phosphatase isoform X2 n=1 Tax=Myxocyprinus asiaticus TaxID=70543 RepID=UPI0022221DBC|nr:type II inositol 1,4,5-trisphosphate 5-phosphatase isoform X2 [Myxocyprinus asiaticus]
MDQSVAIQETLAEGENCIIAVDCVSLLDDVRESRLMGLVEQNKEHALFMYSHRRMAITGDDVTLDEIIPISYDFSVVEGADTRVRVTFFEEELELRLPFGSHTRLFLSEVTKAWSDVCEQHPKEEPKFDWLTKYRKVSKGARSLRKSLPSIVSSRMSQIKRSEGPHTTDNSGLHKDNEQNRGDSGNESQERVREEVRDDLIRSSQPIQSNKAQMLGMPQFGLRDNLIRCELLKNEDSYTHVQNYSFFLGTYNVNGQNPKESLSPWLGFTPNPPDFYLVGFQELDLSKEAFLFNDTPKEPEWMLAVYQGLHPDAKYALVKLVRLVGIMLLFYVKAEHAAHISEVEVESVGTGVMGRMGNKGAVAIHFRFHNSDICVVNSHLAAHTEDYERRNQDFKDICRRMQFGQDPTLPPITIMKHNVVLWLGDLNYRISDLEADHVKDLIAKKDFESLYNHDQLKRQMDEEAVFVGFIEGEIDFQPTYKYDTGSDHWDTSEKCRVPAWCDRILWRGNNIKQLHYQSHMTLKTSDHKPVSALLEIGIKVVNEESYKRKFEEIVRHIDRLENDCIPSVSLSQREFHFKDVKFMQHQAETVSVHNDGQVPCQFEFIPKLDEPAYCKPWLTANPAKGFLAQGASVDIDLEVFVNSSMAPGLNSGQQQLEDILVLHLERGKDYFISITGSYLPSCFGSSLSTLCLLREPIQDMPPDTIREMIMKSNNQMSDPEADKPQEIPKEIWMMVDHLFRYAKKQEDLFQQPGLRSEFEEIRDCLDTGSLDTLPGSSHSVAEALLLFLDALPEPVIPFSFYQQCLDCSSDSSQCRQIISMLPQCHKNVFNYLMAFLQELLKHSAHNRLDVNILASIFSGLLLRSPTKQDITKKRKVKEFFLHFLVQSPSDRGIHDKLPE